MDLSKIPEPSEVEIELAMYLIRNPPESHSAYSCVIAHLLRHGKVLAAFAKRHGMHRSSIEFFEKFGGNDER